MTEMFLALSLLSPIEDEKDRRALARLYKNYYKTVCKRIRRQFRISQEVAEDCVQQSYLKIARNIKRVAAIDGRSQLAYVLKAARTVAIDYLSKNQRISFVEIKDDDFDGLVFIKGNLCSPKAETVVENWESLRIFNERLCELTDTERVVYQLYFLENLSREELATRLNISVDSVRTYISRTKIHVKKILKEIYAVQ